MTEGGRKAGSEEGKIATLRRTILQGGSYLAAREGLGILIGSGSMIVLMRLLGPYEYGLYAAAVGIVGYLNAISRLGVDVFLVRREEEPGPEYFAQGFTITFLSSAVLVMAVWVGSPLLERWYGDSDFIGPLRILSFSLPLTAMVGPPLARLERDLAYPAVAGIELAGHASYAVVAVVLALLGYGVWSPVIGLLSRAALVQGALCVAARLLPRPHWSWSITGEMLRYGSSYSAARWVEKGRTLVNPLLVGRFVGAEGVAFVALALRLGEVIAFVKKPVWRVSLATFPKLLDSSTQKVRKALQEAIALQVTLVGAPLALAALLGPWIIPPVLGERWVPMLTVFPFVAVGVLAHTAFSMHSSLLYVKGRNLQVAVFNFAFLAVFAMSALALTSALGIIGYGLAELCALPAYLIVHWLLTRYMSVSYEEVLTWALAFLPIFFTPLLAGYGKLLLCTPALFVLALPATRRRIERLLSYAREVMPFGA